jgi:hypothetical protein
MLPTSTHLDLLQEFASAKPHAQSQWPDDPDYVASRKTDLRPDPIGILAQRLVSFIIDPLGRRHGPAQRQTTVDSLVERHIG